jgi:DHA1 family multidrug resistance protein-like MFS transporter
MKKPLIPSILSALVLAFSSFGDAFLYTALPVNALQMNVPVVWIGFLLSVNRFIRLFANHLFAYLFHRFGFKRITIVATVFSVISTFMYGIASGIVVWIIARIIWGFCFSALRISTISYSLENKNKGFSLGLNRGLNELGPIIALLAGPLLLQWTNPATTFFILSLATIPAIIIAWYLPELNSLPLDYTFSVNLIPSSFNLLTFLTSFFVQGILIVTITILLPNQDLSLIALMSIAGIYLAFRRICTVVVSPVGGILADKWGIDKVYLISIFLTISGFLLIAVGLTKTGIIIAFMFNSVTASLAPGTVVADAIHHTVAHPLKVVAENNTWSDIGAATGTFIAGSLLPSTHIIPMFFIASVLLLAACRIHIRATQFQMKGFLQWK